MSEIIKDLKKARKDKGYTQAGLGRRMHLPQSHISSIENEHTDPRLSSVNEMSNLLGLELMLVPKLMVPMIKAIIRGDKQDPSQVPRWQPDLEDEL